jgi:hypothetical protein
MAMTELDIFKMQAENGDTFAQYFLGECYLNGYGTAVDKPMAAYWYQKAAEKGNAEAQWSLANIYQEGCEQIPKDTDKALYWYEQSASQGYVVSQHYLGTLYLSGIGCEQNFEKALFWFNKAAEQGDDQSQYDLGLCYQEGKGVSRNQEMAIYWWRKAAALGNLSAKRRLA